MNKCKGCQWYNKPYWSVVSPCNSCYKDEEITVYISPKGYGESYHELEHKIEKAIEYIENHKLDRKQNMTTILDSYTMQERDLLNILRGDNK